MKCIRALDILISIFDQSSVKGPVEDQLLRNQFVPQVATFQFGKEIFQLYMKPLLSSVTIAIVLKVGMDNIFGIVHPSSFMEM